MIYDLYRNGVVIRQIRPEGELVQVAMQVDIVNAKFRENEFSELQIGDYIIINGQKYCLNIHPEHEKKSNREYLYSVQFEHESYILNRVPFLGYDSTNALNEEEFPMRANADMILDLIVANLNNDYSGWSKGYFDTTELIDFNFKENNCFEALQQAAEQFKCEFWFDGKVVNLGTRVIATTLTLEYGKGKGLYNLNRTNKDNSNPFNKLIVRGGERNVPSSYRYKKLLMPVATNGGYFLKDDALITAYGGTITAFKEFPEIYPKRVGTVTSVDTNPLIFFDSSMDFDVNTHLISGQSAKVTFNTGLLAGYEFELSAYDNATKKYTVNVNSDEKGLGDIPNSSFKPAVGDQYFVFDINMPASYIDAAETELFNAATDYFNKSTDPSNRFIYSADVDPIFFRDNSIVPTVSMKAQIVDTPMGVDQAIRITSVTTPLQPIYGNLNQYRLEFSNIPKISSYDRAKFIYQNIKYKVESSADSLVIVADKAKEADYLKVALQKMTTEVINGLILSGVIAAKDVSDNVRAYVSGLVENEIAFAAGVENFGSLGETQKIALNHDGTGKLAAGNFTWDSLGKIIANEIELQSGKVGSILINATGLYAPNGISIQHGEISSGEFVDYSGNLRFKGFSMNNNGASFSNKTNGDKTVVTLEARQQTDAVTAGDIPLRIKGGYVYMDDVRDAAGTGNAIGRVRFFTDGSGRKVLYLDGSSF